MCGYYYYFFVIIIIITLQFSFYSVGSNPYCITEKTNRNIQKTTQKTVQATQNILNTSKHSNKTPTQTRKRKIS